MSPHGLLSRTESQRRRTAPWLLVAQLAVTGFVTTACTRRPPPPLTIGITPRPGAEPLRVAVRKGMFRDLGLHPRVLQFSARSDCRRALSRGRLDAALLTAWEAVSIMDDDNRIAIVLVTDVSPGPGSIIVRSGLKGLHDLVGARVGVASGSNAHLWLSLALQEAGIAPSTVQVVSAAEPILAARCAAGDLDAVAVGEPWRTRLVATEGLTEIRAEVDEPALGVGVLVVRRESLERRREEVHQLMTAWFLATTFVEEQPDAAIPIMASAERLQPERYRALWQTVKPGSRSLNRRWVQDSPQSPLMQTLRSLFHRRQELTGVTLHWRPADLLDTSLLSEVGVT